MDPGGDIGGRATVGPEFLHRDDFLYCLYMWDPVLRIPATRLPAFWCLYGVATTWRLMKETSLNTETCLASGMLAAYRPGRVGFADPRLCGKRQDYLLLIVTMEALTSLVT